MKEQINEEMLEEINGGVISCKWRAATQSGTVSSNKTGQTLTFGADKFNAVFNYIKTHQYEADDVQMAALQNIIG